MRRGEIYWISLDPSLGREANKDRPAVIVSNDGANSMARKTSDGVITIVPITSSSERVYPFQTLIPAGVAGLEKDSKAQAEQIRSISILRVGEIIGELPRALMRDLDAAIALHLGL